MLIIPWDYVNEYIRRNTCLLVSLHEAAGLLVLVCDPPSHRHLEAGFEFTESLFRLALACPRPEISPHLITIS